MKSLPWLLVAAAALATAACSVDNPNLEGESLLQTDRPTVWFDTSAAVPASAQVTITNVGPKPALTLVTQVHGDIDEIDIAEDDCSGHTLAPRARCTVTLALHSDVAGTFDGQLVVAPAGDPGVEVEVHGKVPPAALRLTLPVSSSIDVTPGGSGTIVLVLANAGGARSGPIALTADAGVSVSAPCLGGSLAGGEDCQVTARFQAPTSLGPVSATVTASADPGGSQTVPLPFEVVPAALDVSGYYQVVLTGESAKASVLVHNQGPTSARWTSARVLMDVPANNGACAIVDDPCKGMALAPDQTCQIWLQCTARGLGFNTGHLVLSDDHARTVGQGAVTVFGSVAIVRVTYAGAGHGEVRGPSGGFLGDSMTATFGLLDAQPLTITATPEMGSTFSGWSGACSGTAPTCTVTPIASSIVTAQARFD